MTRYVSLTMLRGPTLAARCISMRTGAVTIRAVGSLARRCVADGCESGSALWRAIRVASRA